MLPKYLIIDLEGELRTLQFQYRIFIKCAI